MLWGAFQHRPILEDSKIFKSEDDRRSATKAQDLLSSDWDIECQAGLVTFSFPKRSASVSTKRLSCASCACDGLRSLAIAVWWLEPPRSVLALHIAGGREGGRGMIAQGEEIFRVSVRWLLCAV